MISNITSMGLINLSPQEMQATYGGKHESQALGDEIRSFLCPTLLTAVGSSFLYIFLRGMPQARLKFSKACGFYHDASRTKMYPKSVLRYLGIDKYVENVHKEIKRFEPTAEEPFKNKPLLNALSNQAIKKVNESNLASNEGQISIELSEPISQKDYCTNLKALYDFEQSPSWKKLNEYQKQNKVALNNMVELAAQLEKASEAYIEKEPNSQLSLFCDFLGKEAKTDKTHTFKNNEHINNLRDHFNQYSSFRKDLWEVVNLKFKDLEKLKAKLQAHDPKDPNAQIDPELKNFEKHLKNVAYKNAVLFGLLTGTTAFVAMKAAQEQFGSH